MKNILLKYLLPAILIAIFSAANAQISSVKLLTRQPLEYEKTELNIGLTAVWDNPYLQQDVALDMLIISPTAKKLVLPCYYEEGLSGKLSTWKARFAAQEVGKYTYSFRFKKAGVVSSTSKLQTLMVKPSGKNGFLHVKNNWIMQFDNGKPFRGIGENIAWESRASDDSKYFKELHEKSKYNYEYMLPSLAHHGGNFFRTWISSFNLPIDWHRGFNSNRYTPSDRYFNPSAIAKMDRLVTLSDSLGVYMMLTLGQGASGLRDGGFSPNSADFFVNPLSKERYKNRLRYIIARWGYSSSIGVWELFNEVDNVQFANKNKPISADSIVQWHDEMSTYIKQTDPYQHPVTTSISHRDLKGLNSLPNIDFNQKHIYKNTASIPQSILRYENGYNKPYVIGEYSYEWDWSKNFDDFPEGMDSDFKRGMWYGLFSPTPILPMSWWWEYFDNRGTDAYFNRVKTISDEMLAAGNGDFKLLDIKSVIPGVVTYGVQCGKTEFLYVYNTGTVSKSLSLDVPAIETSYQSTWFDCESEKTKEATVTSGAAGQLKVGGELPAGADVVIMIKTANNLIQIMLLPPFKPFRLSSEGFFVELG